jgi:predicted LPLAT superfamily acyltransferase
MEQSHESGLARAAGARQRTSHPGDGRPGSVRRARIARLTLIPFVLHFLLFGRKARAASRQYLQRVLAQPVGFRQLFRHYFTFATVAMDRFFLLKERYGLYETRNHGEELLHEILKSGQGCLLLGAHMGSFEILRALGTANHVDCRAGDVRGQCAHGEHGGARDQSEIAKCIIPLGRFDSMLKSRSACRTTMDRDTGRSHADAGRDAGVTFLGEKTQLPTAPFRIALMLKSPGGADARPVPRRQSL